MKVFFKPFARSGERRSGDVLEAFDAKGTVRLLGRTADGLQLEHLSPGTPLSTLAAIDDEKATEELASVISVLAPRDIPAGLPTVADWSWSFDKYLETGGGEIHFELVRHARAIYQQLCESQREVRLLHGDLHHDNILFDHNRGWVAIDPKGVVGELEYEVGAALRNPIQLPHVFTDPAVIDTRVRILSDALSLNRERVVAWAYAQAVLATIWLIEDGEPVAPGHPWTQLSRQLPEASHR